MRRSSSNLVRMSVATFGLLVSLTSVAVSQTEIRTERVQFVPGESSAVVEDTIQGYTIVDYVLGAGKGQFANISMATDNTSNYFNILAPEEDDVAIFTGSVSGNQFEGVLPASGDYKVRVYMMRSAARRYEVASYRLEIMIEDSDGDH